MATSFTMRLRQGVRALLADFRPVDEALAARTLDAPQLALFQRMTRSEQLHSLNVLRDLLAQEAHTPHDLAQAALLHDVGKSRCPLSVAQRSLAVAVASLWPALDARWRAYDEATDPPPDALPWWRAGSVVRYHHPAWGAQLAQDVGLSERALWLIAHHAQAVPPQHPHAALLRRLQQADDAN